MIVERGTFNVKPGCTEELVALVLAEIEKVGPPTARVYTPHIGPYDVLAIEWEFENLAERDKYWEAWFAKPETAAFVEKFLELAERGGGNEVWNLEE